MPSLWRSPYSDFGQAKKVHNDLEDETVTADAVYTDEVLADIAGQGFNGIWVHGLLRHVVRSRPFPEFGRHAATHLQSMRRLVKRADKYGVKVYVYCQPPRAIQVNDPFWKQHPDVAGAKMNYQSDDGYPLTLHALCTSTEAVKQYLRDASEQLVRKLPGLGGVILITASEHASHCYGLMPGERYLPPDTDQWRAVQSCPRCAERAPQEVVAEIVQLVRDGVRAASQDAQIIAWDWCWWWYEKSPCPTVVGLLPDDVTLMSGFEQGGRKKIMGKMRPVEEYSLSYAGPSPHFLGIQSLARRRGLYTMAKLQVGTTHELATVPNLPLIGNLYTKVKAMRELGVDGFMGCWNFGNMASANSAAFNRFFRARSLPPKRKALTEFAACYFPGCRAGGVADAWKTFAEAMNDYPFSIPFMYSGPNNYSLVCPMKPGPANTRPLGRSWRMDRRGDSLELSLAFPLVETIGGLGRLAKAWRKGAETLEDALQGCDGGETARAERDNAWVCSHVFRSTWNTYRAWRLRRSWSEAKRDNYLRIARDELANLEAVLPLVANDARFGWHAEPNAYMYDAAGIRKKIAALKRQTEA